MRSKHITQINNNSNALIALCRPGCEKSCAAELKDLVKDFEDLPVLFGNGYVYLDINEKKLRDFALPPAHRLVFTRDVLGDARFYRINNQTPLADLLAGEISTLFTLSGYELLYESVSALVADPEQEKGLSQFAQKLGMAVENRIKKVGFKKVFKNNQRFLRIGILLVGDGGVFVGVTEHKNRSPHIGGVVRLRADAKAPSRSHLKLEEAFATILSPSELENHIKAGMTAIDLGAAPGGWTYAMIKRGIFVTAIDHAKIKIPSTELFQHIEADAFKFVPKEKTDWLLCDVVANPYRIASLIAEWGTNDRFHSAIFNLKMPMGDAWSAWVQCRETLYSCFHERFEIRAKHLYHDRDEITVIVLGQ